MSGVRSKTFDQRVTSETLPPLCTVMAVSYVLMAIAHAWLLPEGNARIVMIISAVLTSIIAFLVGRWLQVAQSFEKHATAVVLSLFGLALVNCGLHMYLLKDPGQTPLFALTIVAAGFFIASFLTLTISLVAIMAVWWLLFAALGDFTNSVNFVFLISIACAVSLTVNLARTRNLHRLEVERERAARQIEMIGQDRRLYLQRILQAMEPGLCTVDADGYISLVNSAFAALLNGTPESLTGLTIQEATKATALQGRLHTRLRDAVEVRLGTGRTVRLSETRLPSENGVQSGRLVIAIDVSSQKHLEEERVKLLRSVQETQRLAALGSASARMAHDFNNHLAIITGSLEMLSVQLPDNTYVAGAMEASNAAAAATRQLQAMAAERQHIFQAVSVDTLLNEASTVLDASAPHGIRFELRLDDADVIVNADKQQLEQAIFNIAMNAAESYGGDEGRVMISAARRSAGGETLVEIRVSDDGQGIDAKTQDEFYTPFNTTKGPGRGLGLPASNEIVQQHGGTIDIRSAPGAGTTVAILIPAAAGVSELD